MSSTVFLHKFHQGREVAIPFDEAIEFLSGYGTPGNGDYRSHVTFPPDEIAEIANVVGDEARGALCIAFNRPFINDQFRTLVFEAMQQFGLTAYEDTFDWVYVLPASDGDVPQALLDELSSGVREVSTAGQLWQEWGVGAHG
ncbi:hypothetical protein [Xanthomonas arboricola]|uniref:hypothetical protein n=1 Tax=Xanthomonas arboricola TaxID=56448 RepID=UPI0011B0AEFB|nr:hypothetical protein [Xanthomonas arboricola]